MDVSAGNRRRRERSWPVWPRTVEVPVAAAAYLGLLVGITWPLAAHLTTHWLATGVGCLVDQRVQATMLVHQSRALVGALATFAHPAIFHPTRWALFFGEPAFGALPLFLPPFLATGNPVLALNVVFVGGVVSTAAALYAVGRGWGASPLNAWIGGAVFATNPWTVWTWGADAPNFTVLGYWPVVMALAAREPAPPVVPLGLLLALQGSTSVYVAVGVFVPFAVLILVRLARRDVAFAGGLTAAGVVGSALLVPVFGWYLRVRSLEPALAEQTLVKTTHLTWVVWPFQAFDGGHATAVPAASLALLVVGTLLVRGASAAYRRAWWNLLVWAGVALAISLPPRVELFGRPVTTPMGGLASLGIPIVAVRDTRRLGIGMLLAASLATGLALERLLGLAAGRLGRRWLWVARGAAAAAVVWSLARHLTAPTVPSLSTPTPGAMPLYDARDWAGAGAALVAATAAAPGPVLELPPSPFLQAMAIHRATVHRQPTLNGTNSYYPAAFERRMRLACALPAPEAVRQLRAETGVTLIAVWLDLFAFGYQHEPPFGCRLQRARGTPGIFSAETRAWAAGKIPQWEALVTAPRPDLELLRREGSLLLFRVHDDRAP